MEKLYRIFEHELTVSQNLPYKSIFQLEPFRGYLFEEFKAAELKPCNWLYQEEYYSQDEYEKILRHERMQDEKNAIPWSGSGSIPVMATTFYPSEYSIILHQIEIEFLDKVHKKSLDSQFFCPDILKTPTALILLEIKKKHESFKKLKFKSKRTKLKVEKIANALKSITNEDLKNKVLGEVIADDFNLYSSSTNWTDIKDEFNDLLLDKMQNDIGYKNDNQQPPDHSELLKALSEYITGISSPEFTNIIEKHSTTSDITRATWIGEPVVAHRFATFIGMKVSLWKKCFTGVKNKKGEIRQLLNGDKERREWKKAPINEILKKHLNK